MQSTPFIYIETSIPAGVTISEFRRSRPQRPSGWRRLFRGLRLA
jgi:hypothetical protein